MSEISVGSIDAFAVLYDRFSARAHGLAFAVCRDHGRAEDAVQDAFLSIWTSRGSYHPQRGTVAAWLLTVVRYRAIDVARRDNNHAIRWISDDHLDERPALENVGAEVIQRDDAHRLRSSMTMLPDEQREVIALAYYGQLSHTEIAAQLGLPAGTVKGRMRLGLQKLRLGAEPAIG